jgi:Membrane-bound metallopeptidase
MQYLAFILAADVKSYLDEDAQLDKDIAEITERGKKLKKEIGELTTEISALNKHNANTEAAIDSINKILRDDRLILPADCYADTDPRHGCGDDGRNIPDDACGQEMKHRKR